MKTTLALVLSASIFSTVATVTHAAIVDGMGSEATWVYQESDGNLTLRSESDHRYKSFVLQTNGNHFDISSDLDDRFLFSDHPGFQPVIGPPIVADELFFLLTEDPCVNCLEGTSNFGRIMLPNIPKGEMLDNWFSRISFDPSGGVDSGIEPNAVGLEYVPSSPAVTGVYLKSGPWKTRFLNELDAASSDHSSLGHLGYRVPSGAAQLAPLPWPNMDTIAISFDDRVTVQSGHLTLTGAAGGTAVPSIQSFAMLDDFTAAWTFDAPLDRNRFLLTLADSILGSQGTQLDGEWSNGVTESGSGDGVAGGPFEFRIDVLPGDINQSGSVAVDDVHPLRQGIGWSAGAGDYTHTADLNGSGILAINDLGTLRVNFGKSLPASAPIASNAISIPEPSSTSSLTLALVAVVGGLLRRSRCRQRPSTNYSDNHLDK